MHYYKILKHKAGFDEGTNYWEKILARYLAATGGGKIRTTLPITFTSTSWKLASWTIYGNNYEHKYSTSGTLPLTFTTHTAGNADDWSISGNDDVGENLLDTNASDLIQINAKGIMRYGVIVPNLPAGVYTLSMNTPLTNPYYLAKRVGSVYTNIGLVSGSYAPQTITLDEQCDLIIRTAVSSVTTWETYFGINPVNMMLTKGSTAPDHYIPYQQGVGERTANLLPYVNGTYTHNRMTVTCNNGRYVIDIAEGTGGSIYTIPLPEFKIPVCQAQGGNGVLLLLNSTASYTMNVTLKKGSSAITSNLAIAPVNRVITNYTNDTSEVLCDGLQIYYGNISGTAHMELSPMLINTAQVPTTFIPYGYQIPFTVSQAGQTDKNYDIYIGDTPLTAGQSISKTSTGIDLELFEGENTVSTTLYNKPETSITYTDYLGVGEYVNGQWQIPLALSHITDNLFDKDATDTDNGYEDDTRTYWRQAIYGLRLIIEPNADYCTSEYIPVTAGTDYYPSDVDISIEALFSATFYTVEKTLIYMAFSSADKITAPENAAYIRVCVEKSKLNSAMLTTKPTSEYIPHKQSTDYTIPIDAPLTEGQTVSDTTEIEVFEGENTIDTTLYNKPEMEITYE